VPIRDRIRAFRARPLRFVAMKPRLAGAAIDRLANTSAADEPPMTEDEVMRVLARIARSGKPSDRLRAAELIGKQLGMFRDKGPGAYRGRRPLREVQGPSQRTQQPGDRAVKAALARLDSRE